MKILITTWKNIRQSLPGILFVLLSTPVFAQNSSTLLDSIIGYKNKTIYHYDNIGREILKENSYWSESENKWIKSIRITQEYKPNERTSKTENYYPYDNKWRTLSYRSYKGDNIGTQMSSEFYSWDPFLNVMSGTKSIRTYNKDSTQVSNETYYWLHSLNTWVGSVKTIYSYHKEPFQTLISYHTFDWSETQNKWLQTGKETQEIGQNGELISTDFIRPDEQSPWEFNTQTVSPYNSSGETITYKWSATINNWIEYSKVTHDLNSNGKDNSSEYYKWNTDSNAWLPESKYIYEYDQNGNTTLNEKYTWSEEQKKWYCIDRTISGYDSDNNENYKEIYVWNSSENKLKPSNKTFYEVKIDLSESIDGRITEFTSHNPIEAYEWSTLYNAWIGTNKNINTYDNEGRQLSRESYHWNNGSMDWEPEPYSKDKYTYTFNNDLISSEERHVWNFETEDWKLFEKKTYYYKSSPTGIPNTNKAEISISYYDNQIRIPEDVRIAQLAVYSVTGQLISQTRNHSITTTGWAEGVYILKLTTEDGRKITQKILIH